MSRPTFEQLTDDQIAACSNAAFRLATHGDKELRRAHQRAQKLYAKLAGLRHRVIDAEIALAKAQVESQNADLAFAKLYYDRDAQ